MSEIALLDPSLNPNDNLVSNNSGDEIIYRAIDSNFFSNLKNVNVSRFSSHRSLTVDEINHINGCSYLFFGGTNIISRDVCHDSKWIPAAKKFYYLKPGIKNLILLGVGMNRYTEPNAIKSTCRLRTWSFYNKVLTKRYIHSTRDNETAQYLKSIGVKNVLFTGCPTLWAIDERIDLNLLKSRKKCLFALTDYDKNSSRDNEIISQLLKNFEELVYFPQGHGDEAYLKQLDSYTIGKERISILSRSLNELDRFSLQNDFVFVGTRLHLGIYLLNKNIPALIIGIDNRAIEMAKSINLPVINLTDLSKISSWCKGDGMFGKINLPHENIEKWKNQFNAL